MATLDQLTDADMAALGIPNVGYDENRDRPMTWAEKQLAAEKEQERQEYQRYQELLKENEAARLKDLEDESRYMLQAKPEEYDLDKYVLKNEKHPDVPITTRLVAKNLGAEPEAVRQYVKRQLDALNEGTEYDVQYDSDGELVIRKAGEGLWRRMDPEGVKDDLLADIGDVAFDVPAGIIEGLASAAGGVGGALGTGGWGALPGAMAGGALAGAGMESLRQHLGALTDLGAKNYNPEMLGVGAIGGAAAPLVFGSGASRGYAGQQLKKEIAKRAAAPEIAQEGAEVLGEMGIRAMPDLLPEQRALRELGEQRLPYMDSRLDDSMIYKQLEDQLMKQQSGLPMRGLRGTARLTGSVATGFPRDDISRAIDNLDILEQNSGDSSVRQMAAGLKNDVFSRAKEFRQGVQKRLQDYRSANGNVEVPVEEVVQPFLKLRAEYQKKVQDFPYNDFYKDQLAYIDSIINNKLGFARKERVTRMPHLDVREEEIPLETVAFEEVQNLKDELNDLTDIAKMVEGRDVANPIQTPAFQGRLRATATEAAVKLNKAIDQAIPDDKQLRQDWKNSLLMNSYIRKNFGDMPGAIPGEKAEQTIRKLAKEQNATLKAGLEEIGDILGVDLERDVFLRVYADALYPKSSFTLNPFTRQGLETIGRTGAAAGLGSVAGYGIAAGLGGGHGMGVPGAYIGGALGAGAVSPWVLQQYMKAIRGGRGPWRAMAEMGVPFREGTYLPVSVPGAAIRATDTINRRDQE